MYIKIVLFVTFIILNITVYYVTDRNTQTKIEYAKFHHLNKLQLNYEIFMINQSEKADVIYETTINTKGLLKSIKKAWNTKDIKERDRLREELYSDLQAPYERLKRQGLLQYHIVFPDNTSFLRLHKPNKFGDDLTNIRSDFVKVNKDKELIRGFSQGRTAHAFRNVYPLFDNDGTHIGAIEISYPSELLQRKLNDISEIHSHFLVNKHIFDSKAWDRNDRVINYEPSLEHKDYLLALSGVHNRHEHLSNLKERIEILRKDIDKNIEKELMFSLISKYNTNDFKVVSFYPIYQNTTFELSAWLVSYNNAPIIYPAFKDSIIIRTIAFFILSILFYFIYKTITQKDKLSQILLSYDNNVIFSTTDLKGKITHVSKAFCDISGYSESELLGKPHSIVRHPDMPKSVFKEMWETIKGKNVWKGEVKNLKKDGSFYWVEAEIEPLIDDAHSHIGYIAIRHDITSQKELQNKEMMLLEQSKMAAMGEMLESIAHQWKQPLSAITTHATSIDLYQQTGMLTDEKLNKAIEGIDKSAKHLATTIDDFRNFYKTDTSSSKFSVKDAIEKSKDLVISKLTNRDIRFTLDFNDATVIGYENEIIQVFMNIINNAIDALDDVEQVDKIIQVTLLESEDHTKIYFQDNAGGIPNHIISNIFDYKFTTKGDKEGTGIGLYMSKLIVEKSNATLSVLNKEIEYNDTTYTGACFILSIPNKEANNA